MNDIKMLNAKVKEMYESHNPSADVWVDWAYNNHVLWVANYAEKLAIKHNARLDLVVAGALLHDIADAVMDRDEPEHEKESMLLAEKLLRESKFTEDDIATILYEIIEPHSCSKKIPTTLEGKIVATADGASHFLTDFYPYFCWQHYGPDDNYDAFKEWALKKIEKDYTRKIFFEEVKREIEPKYNALKLIFA